MCGSYGSELGAVSSSDVVGEVEDCKRNAVPNSVSVGARPVIEVQLEDFVRVDSGPEKRA